LNCVLTYLLEQASCDSGLLQSINSVVKVKLAGVVEAGSRFCPRQKYLDRAWGRNNPTGGDCHGLQKPIASLWKSFAGAF
jgi:hypothetical protein